MISYANLTKASELYEALGYKRIEVPWWATKDIVNITKPTGMSDDNLYGLSLNNKCLIASGEQAFLYLANKGQLPPGKYQTITPCFRNEPYDQYHSKHFMKLELIDLNPAPELLRFDKPELIRGLERTAILTLAEQALAVMAEVAGDPKAWLRVVPTGAVDPTAVPGANQLDVVLELVDSRQIELGSYGARRTSFATWFYGTGLAEPRFSRALAEGVYIR